MVRRRFRTTEDQTASNYTERCPKKPSISSRVRPVRLLIISVKVMVTKDRETKCLAAFIKTLCRGLNLSPAKRKPSDRHKENNYEGQLQSAAQGRTQNRRLPCQHGTSGLERTGGND